MIKNIELDLEAHQSAVLIKKIDQILFNNSIANTINKMIKN